MRSHTLHTFSSRETAVLKFSTSRQHSNGVVALALANGVTIERKRDGALLTYNTKPRLRQRASRLETQGGSSALDIYRLYSGFPRDHP